MMKRISKKAFTLMEILIYIGVLGLIVGTVSSFLIWGIHSHTKSKVMRETLDNARRAMEIMSRETREAKSIYTQTTTAEQLSLETTHYLPEGEKTSFIDFYLCDSRLCIKKESQNPIYLTSDNVEVKNLSFIQIISGQIPSIQINIKIDYKNPTNRPEYQAEVELISAASLRNY